MGGLRDRLVSTVIARGLSLPPAGTHEVVREDDVPIPMDDGVTLLADIYTPAGSAAVPTVLVRTPYGRKGIFGALQGRVLAERGLRSVLQSCRGTYGSGGTFEIAFAERADGLATIRWIEAQPWFDGRLGMLGPSYLGYAQWVVAAEAGPSLKAICPHTTTAHLAGHWYDSGSLTLDDAINWSTLTATQEAQRWPLFEMLTNRWPRRVARVVDQLPVEDLDEAVLEHRDPRWRSIVEHAEDQAYWQPADATNDVARVTVPVNVVTGWYDLFLPLQLAEYRMLVDAGRPPRMTIGPWTHAQREMAACSMRESIAWLTAHLEADGAGSTAAEARVRVQIMGSGEWREFATWPPDGYAAQRWHLQPVRRLSPDAPASPEPSRYTYDPADPTPVRGGAILDVRRGRRHDQRTVEARDDVLCFTSAVLTSDVEIVGEVDAEIHVASDVPSFDVCVRVCEVDERGRSRNVTDGLVRVASEDPAPEHVQTVFLGLWPTAYRFRKGCRIRVQVASAAFPRYARNLGTGEPIATGTTMRRAHLAIHHSPEHPSAVVLPVRFTA